MRAFFKKSAVCAGSKKGAFPKGESALRSQRDYSSPFSSTTASSFAAASQSEMETVSVALCT